MADKKDQQLSIPEFYSGKSVFLTGFTGIIGKVLVEKLLYSCPDVGTIYVLVRPKKGHSPQQRIEEVFTSVAFNRLKEKYPGRLESKVVGVAGDLLEEGLGLSEEDARLLSREVSIILHGAASVRFHDPLDVAVKINTLGSKRIVDLALTMPHLVCLTYISTAFSNCDHLHIKEEVYPPRADWRETLQFCEKIDQRTILLLQAKIIDKMPNTYSFSKSLAEQVINDFRDQLPVLIVRPSLVGFASKEPSAGYDNYSSPLELRPFPMILGIALGIIKCVRQMPQLRTNTIPLDIVVNSTIAATWETTSTRNFGRGKDHAPVYNLCTPHTLLLTSEEIQVMFSDDYLKPHMKKIGIICEPFVSCYSDLSYTVNTLVRHVLSSCIIDLLLVLMGRQPMLLKIRRRVYSSLLLYKYFVCSTFTFESKKFDHLPMNMTSKDRDVFGWDSKSFYNLSLAIAMFDNMKKTVLLPYFKDLKTNSRALFTLYIANKLAVYLTYSLLGFFLYYFNIPSLLLSTVVRLVTFP